MRNKENDRQRIYSFEAFRGLASIIVLLSHLSLGFFPEFIGHHPEQFGNIGFRSSPFYGLVNGTSAVMFFFVLSSYVLVRNGLKLNMASLLWIGLIKRWPRLAGPVLLSVLFSYFLLNNGYYYQNEASLLTNSQWLLNHLDLSPTSLAAVTKMGLTTFFTGEKGLNSNLWTMTYEFYGSIFVYVSGIILILIRRKSLQLVLLISFIFILTPISLYFAAFPLGVLLAAFLPKNAGLFDGLTTSIGLVFAIYLLGHTRGEIAAYWWLKGIDPLVSYLLGSALIISCLELYKNAKLFDGRWARVLGEMSFPIYLVQIPIICSFGSFIMVFYQSVFWASVASIILTIAAAIPLCIINLYWSKTINRITAMLQVWYCKKVLFRDTN